jgi:hypothetical protein
MKLLKIVQVKKLVNPHLIFRFAMFVMLLLNDENFVHGERKRFLDFHNNNWQVDILLADGFCTVEKFG